MNIRDNYYAWLIKTKHFRKTGGVATEIFSGHILS